MRDNVDDSDDESNDESDDSAANDESGNESESDVYFESDDSYANSIDDSDDVYEVLPELQHLNISCSKDLIDHLQDNVEETQVGCVDMDISSPLSVGPIECNVPVMSPEQQVTMEGQNPTVRLLRPGYENDRLVLMSSCCW